MLILFTVFKLILCSQEFDNVSIPWFKTKELAIKQTDKSIDCTLCNSFGSTLKFYNEVDDYLKDIKDSFYTTVLKTEVAGDEVKACSSCFNKVRIFTETQSRKINVVFEYAGTENLWYILDIDGAEPCYIGVEINQKTYVILLNKNICNNTKRLIYLLEVLVHDNGKTKLEQLLCLDDIKTYKFRLLPKGSINIPKTIEVDQKTLDELKYGASLFTLKNILISIAVYYITGTILALLYFNFVATEKIEKFCN